MGQRLEPASLVPVARLLGRLETGYTAISRANDFLAGLATAEKVTSAVKTSLDGQQVHPCFLYMWLAKLSSWCLCWQQEKTILTIRKKPVQRFHRNVGFHHC